VSLIGRPTPLEILDGVQQALTRNVIPELQTDDARAQLANALGLLSYLATNFEDAAQRLTEDIALLTESLTRTIPAIRDSASANLAERLQSAIDNEAPDLRIPSLLAHSDELQEALLEALLFLEPATESGDATLIASRDSLRAALVTLNRRQSS